MKTISKIIVFTFVIMISMVGCQEESTFESMDMAESPIKVAYYNDGKSQQASMLVFKDLEVYKETIFRLEKEVDKWDDQFVEKWNYLDDEALNFKEDEIGFDCEKPLSNFEKQYGFNSMRQKFNYIHEEWLNHEVLDEENDPTDNYPWESFEMALMGENGEVKIGNSIYLFEKNRTIEITDGDISKLISIINGDPTSIDNDNIVVNISNIKSAKVCEVGNAENSKYFYFYPSWYTKGYRMKTQWRIHQNHPAYGDYLKAKTYSYRRKSTGGSWKSYRTNIQARIEGKYTYQANGENGCSGAVHNISIGRSKKRRTLFVYQTLPNGVSPTGFMSFESNQLESVHVQKWTKRRWFGSY